MAHTGLLKQDNLNKILHSTLLQKGSGTFLFTGEQTQEKTSFIEDHIFDQIILGRKNLNLTKENLIARIEVNSFPDYYCFEADTIKIGDAEKATVGTIRHMQKTMVPFAPKETNRKFIFIKDAAFINDQAESALLKLLEEPPANTVFVLSASNSEYLKDTIVSRAIEIRIPRIINPDKVSSDPWERFWYLSGFNEDPVFEKILEKNWQNKLRQGYDQLIFDFQDIKIFESLFFIELKKTFNAENTWVQNQIAILSWQPIYYSIRDALFEGQAPTIGPIRLPFKKREKLLLMEKILRHGFQKMRTRYFGTRAPSFVACYYQMYSSFFPLWSQ